MQQELNLMAVTSVTDVIGMSQGWVQKLHPL